MQPASVHRSALNSPTLEANQQDTLQSIERALSNGVPYVEIWGVSGTGKSALSRHLRKDPRVEIVDQLLELGGTDSGRTRLEFKTGIPDFADRCDPLDGRIFHFGFDAEKIIQFGSEELARRGSSFRRDESESTAIAQMLTQLGVGSVIYYADLMELPLEKSLPTEMARLFFEECRRADNSDPIGALGFLAAQAPIDLAYAQEKLRIMESMADCFDQFLNVSSKDFLQYSPHTQRQFSEQKIADIKTAMLGSEAVSATMQSTIQWYQYAERILQGRSEPSFLLRTKAPFEDEALSRLCHQLEPVLQILNLSSFGVMEFQGKASIDGDAGRKTGLYRYTGGQKDVYDGHVYIDVPSDLEPVILMSHESRVGFRELYTQKGESIANGTLVYGGGDHSLRAGHIGLCLGLELFLQKYQIPYDVVRGSLERPECTMSFTGENLVSPGQMLRVSADA